MLYCQTRTRKTSMTDSVTRASILMRALAEQAVSEVLAEQAALMTSLIFSVICSAEAGDIPSQEETDRARAATCSSPLQLHLKKRHSAPRSRYTSINMLSVKPARVQVRLRAQAKKHVTSAAAQVRLRHHKRHLSVLSRVHRLVINAAAQVRLTSHLAKTVAAQAE